MYISVFDLFKIGIGPSSSHTVGPMIAAQKFISNNIAKFNSLHNVKVTLYGSLAYTFKGHGTDRAIILGLCQELPDQVDIAKAEKLIDNVLSAKEIFISDINKTISFNIDNDILLNKIDLSNKYSNTLKFEALDKKGNLLCSNKYYSIGGGFIIDEADNVEVRAISDVPYNFDSSKELLELCSRNNYSISELILKNELAISTFDVVENKILEIWKVMNNSIYNGMQNAGTLEGGINLKRRANNLYKKLLKNTKGYDPLYVMDWVNIFAIAVSEENAAFGKIVTAPTNGAAGIIPSVIKYYVEFCENSNNKGIIRFFLAASAIGSLFKKNASISGAEAGCQGEIGVACSMAAAGLVAALEGTNEQIENAAEIAMEHNLGLTCDPINGLVQIPCIERNAMGAMKAINAARLSINGSGQHKVSLDEVIATMWETGKNMNRIYKETSEGGLAVNVTEC